MSAPALADRLLDAFVIRQRTQDSGLPGSQIADLEPGPDGFLWLACGGALCRFDGAAADLLLRLPSTNQLGVSQSAVRHPIEHIYRKLHVRSRSEAITRYLRRA